MSNKDIYRAFCKIESTIPIFCQDWWLDCVCGGPDFWDVAIVEKKGKILATMPYWIKHRYGFTLIRQPPLTQTLGPWFRYDETKYSKLLSNQKNLMQSLIKQLPEFDDFVQNWNRINSNWLPFYWDNFTQTTRYSYILEDLSDKNKLWSNLQENIRREIRKAKNRYKLKIRDDVELDDFLRLNRLTFKRQNKSLPYSEEFIHQLDSVCKKNNCRKIFIAEDPDGRLHAGVYIIWDENTAYYLMGGGDPKLRNSGASSLCMWHAISYAATVTKVFDFEGSMLEPVERFFRAFGSVQSQYFTISKTPSRLLRIRNALNQITRQI